MKQKILTLILLASLSFPLFATHIAGGELTYRCIGANDYEITLVFYRDCTDSSNVSAPTSISLNLKSITCGQSFTISNIPRVPGTGQVITQVCPQFSPACNQGLYVVQKYVYIASPVTLFPCPDWEISYKASSRSNSINTIQNSVPADMYLFTTLNNVLAPCNNSPVFTRHPTENICVGQTYAFNHGTFDPDGDSLSFSLVAPYDSETQQVIYIAPFSASQFFISNPPIVIDSTTGIITINAQQQNITVTAILVEEWRKIGGMCQKIGSVIRDIQLNSIVSNNSPPLLSGIDTVNTQYDPNSKDYSMTVCYGNPINFKIFGIDPDSTVIKNDSLTITWDSLITNASFTVVNNGTPKPYATFSWNPAPADSGKTHHFTVTIADNNCPYLGVQQYSYSITIVGTLPSGIKQEDNTIKQFNIYPNPNQGSFFIEGQASGNDCILTIFSITGRKILEQKIIPDTKGLFRREINLTRQPKGLYVIKFSTGDKSTFKRISVF